MLETERFPVMFKMKKKIEFLIPEFRIQVITRDKITKGKFEKSESDWELGLGRMTYLSGNDFFKKS